MVFVLGEALVYSMKKFFSESVFMIIVFLFIVDGSDARYYLSRQWESTNWVIHLQGGGSCITYEECRLRSEGPLGSSLPLDDRITGEWTLSNDPKINPTFHSWNKVLIPYCRYYIVVFSSLCQSISII